MDRPPFCILIPLGILLIAGCSASGPAGVGSSSEPRSVRPSDTVRQTASPRAPASGDRKAELLSDLRAAYVDGDYGEVVRRARSLRRDSLRSPEVRRGYTLLGRAEQARGRHEAAIEALRVARVATIEEDESVVHLDRTLGESYAALYRWDQAASAFRRVLEDQPDDRTVRLALAEVYRQSKDWKRAQQQYTRLVQADSTNGKWWARLAQCDLELYQRDAALQHFARAHKLLPRAPDVALTLSRLYRATDRPKRARTVINKTLSYQGGDPRLWRRKADLAFEQDDLDVAQRAYRRTKVLGDSSATVYRRLGLIEVKREQYARALSPLRASLRRDPLHPRTKLYLGISYLKIDSLEQATSLLQQTIDRTVQGPITKAFKYLGVANNQQGNVAAALRAYRTVLRLQPDRTEIYFRLATVYDEHYREKVTAARYYRRFLRVSDSTQTQFRTYAEDRLETLRSTLHMQEEISDSGE